MRQWRLVTPGKWACSGSQWEWAQHFSNASCLYSIINHNLVDSFTSTGFLRDIGVNNRILVDDILRMQLRLTLVMCPAVMYRVSQKKVTPLKQGKGNFYC